MLRVLNDPVHVFT